MALKIRTFIFESDGTLKYLPKRVGYGLYAQTERLPQYAGKTIRAAQVLIEFEDRMPVALQDVRGHLMSFDEKGELIRDWHGFWGASPSLDPYKREAKVVDLRPKLDRQQWERRNRWELTSDHMDAVIAAVWPAEGAAVAIESIKGVAPKPPPLTVDGREALKKIQGGVSTISFALEGLSEPALKGLAYEARRIGGLESADAALWEAAASLSDRRREIRSRHRKGTGVWYAAVDVYRWNDERTSGEVVDTEAEQCQGKAAAIEAARRLLVKNAHRFGENTSIEARVHCDLEWEPNVIDE